MREFSAGRFRCRVFLRENFLPSGKTRGGPLSRIILSRTRHRRLPESRIRVTAARSILSSRIEVNKLSWYSRLSIRDYSDTWRETDSHALSRLSLNFSLNYRSSSLLISLKLWTISTISLSQSVFWKIVDFQFYDVLLRFFLIPFSSTYNEKMSK